MKNKMKMRLKKILPNSLKRNCWKLKDSFINYKKKMILSEKLLNNFIINYKKVVYNQVSDLLSLLQSASLSKVKVRKGKLK